MWPGLLPIQGSCATWLWWWVCGHRESVSHSMHRCDQTSCPHREAALLDFDAGHGDLESLFPMVYDWASHQQRAAMEPSPPSRPGTLILHISSSTEHQRLDPQCAHAGMLFLTTRAWDLWFSMHTHWVPVTNSQHMCTQGPWSSAQGHTKWQSLWYSDTQFSVCAHWDSDSWHARGDSDFQCTPMGTLFKSASCTLPGLRCTHKATLSTCDSDPQHALLPPTHSSHKSQCQTFSVTLE